MRVLGDGMRAGIRSGIRLNVGRICVLWRNGANKMHNRNRAGPTFLGEPWWGEEVSRRRSRNSEGCEGDREGAFGQRDGPLLCFVRGGAVRVCRRKQICHGSGRPGNCVGGGDDKIYATEDAQNSQGHGRSHFVWINDFICLSLYIGAAVVVVREDGEKHR